MGRIKIADLEMYCVDIEANYSRNASETWQKNCLF